MVKSSTTGKTVPQKSNDTMTPETTYAVILAGGVGTRFWPLSRQTRPKQFLHLADDPDLEGDGDATSGDRTMLQNTAGRINPIIPLERTLVVAAEKHVDLVREQLPDIPSENILGEPAGRNTAPAVVWAAREVMERQPNGIILNVAADHHILNPDAFRTAALAALMAAEERRAIILFGITPDGPRSEYGYILPDPGRPTKETPAILRVRRFHEKPTTETAEQYISAGPCFWNSGMFSWRADTVIDELRRHAPDMLDITDIAIGARNSPERFKPAYERIPSISIDHALLENTERLFVVDSGVKRVDLGNWGAVAELWEKDGKGNSTKGDVLAIDTQGSVLHTEKTLLATIGVEDLVVVVTDDVLLVCPKDRAADVGELVKRLTESGRVDCV
jgi:mannose-1-phosphate guanylyltransferase